MKFELTYKNPKKFTNIEINSFARLYSISALSVETTGQTTQTITATIVGTGYDGVSFENSLDGFTYTEFDTSLTGVLSATGLTAGTQYYWRARPYKGTNYGSYSEEVRSGTEPAAIRNQTGGVNDIVAWYDTKDLTTITKDGNDHITRMNNKLLVAASDLVTIAGTPHWGADGILLDGAGDSLKSATFTYATPEFMYLVIKQITWSANDILISGFPAGHVGSVYQDTAAPGLNVYCGGGYLFATQAKLPLNKWGILRVKINGATSKIQVDKEIAVTGDLGTEQMAGITIGDLGGAGFSNFQFKEALFAKVTAGEADIFNYLDNNHGSNIYKFNHIYLNNILGSSSQLTVEPSALVSDDGNQIDLWFNLDYTIYYSYSTDGKTFSAPTATNITANYCRLHVLKYSGTYYCYAVNYTTAAAIRLFTSTDKVTWTSQGDVLLAGLVYDVVIANMFVWHEGASWYMLYECAETGIPAWKISLATASAPEGPWTKSASNPVMDETDQGCGNPELTRVSNEVVKYGGKYYMYYHRGKTGTRADILRAYSTDLITWTKEGIISDARTISYAPPGTNVDQAMVQFKDKTYMFYSDINQVDEGYIHVGIDQRTVAELLALTP